MLDPFAGERFRLVNRESGSGDQTPPPKLDGITFAPANYARGQVAVHCESDGTGFKSRAMRLCCALKARWSNRCKAYIMSPAKAKRLRQLYTDGWDATACTMRLTPPAHLCEHPPERLHGWHAADGVLCVACCDCGKVLAGAA